MRANTVRPLAFTSASSRSIVSFAPKLLAMVINPSAAIANPPHNAIATNIATDIATNLLAAQRPAPSVMVRLSWQTPSSGDAPPFRKASLPEPGNAAARQRIFSRSPEANGSVPIVVDLEQRKCAEHVRHVRRGGGVQIRAV